MRRFHSKVLLLPTLLLLLLCPNVSSMGSCVLPATVEQVQRQLKLSHANPITKTSPHCYPVAVLEKPPTPGEGLTIMPSSVPDQQLPDDCSPTGYTPQSVEVDITSQGSTTYPPLRRSTRQLRPVDRLNLCSPSTLYDSSCCFYDCIAMLGMWIHSILDLLSTISLKCYQYCR